MAGTWSFVDSDSNNTSSTLGLTGLAAGDHIIVFTNGGANPENFEDNPPTDDASNSYAYGGRMVTLNDQHMTWWTTVHNGALATIVITPPQSAAFRCCMAGSWRYSEYFGGSYPRLLLQKVCSLIPPTTAGTDAVISGDVDTFGEGDHLIAICFVDDAVTLTAGTGLTARETVNLSGGSAPTVLADKTVPSPSTVNASFTISGDIGDGGGIWVMTFGTRNSVPGRVSGGISITADAQDGAGYREAASWAGIASGAFTDADGDDPTVGFVSMVSAGGNFFIDNTFLRFDTSAIPANAQILWAELILHCVSAAAPEDDLLQLAVEYYDFGGTPPVAADWREDIPTTDQCIVQTPVKMLESGKIQTFSFSDLSGIKRAGETNDEGFTGFTGLRLAPASTGASPTDINSVSFALHNHATLPAPQLWVAYWVPPETYEEQVLADTPNAYWRLGDMQDSSGNGLHLTKVGSVVDVDGLLGPTYDDGGQEFPGSATNHLDIAHDDLLNPPGPMSIEGWLKSDVLDAVERPMIHKGNYSIIKTTDNRIRGEFERSTATGGGFGQIFSTLTMGAGTRYHVVVTWDTTEIRLYVNGVANATPVARTGVLHPGGNRLGIGGQALGIWGWWDGVLDEVAIYPIVLSPDRVLAHYEAGITAPAPTYVLLPPRFF